jgi:cystinosin
VSYVKLIVTLIKYAPQAVVNYRNQSTEGWSIYGFWCDFSGGVLSIAQLVIDCIIQGDWSGLTGNSVKLLLGNVSIAYDFVFFAQHYWFYRGAEKRKEEEGEGLLGDEREDEERGRRTD